MTNEKIKVTADLPRETFAALQLLAQKQGVSMTEILRRAIGTYTFLIDAIETNSRILIQTTDGRYKHVLLR